MDTLFSAYSVININSCEIFQISRAHDSDVNVISWSPFQEDFLLSGSDDGSCRVWDMRNTSEPIVHLHYHQKPISVS